MKKITSLLVLIFLFGTAQNVTAQPQHRDKATHHKRATIEDRVDRITTRLYVALELDDSQMKATKSTLTTMFEELQTLKKDSEKRPEKEEVNAIFEKADAEMAKILDESQLEKYERIKSKIQNTRQHKRQHKRMKRPRTRRGW